MNMHEAAPGRRFVILQPVTSKLSLPTAKYAAAVLLDQIKRDLRKMGMSAAFIGEPIYKAGHKAFEFKAVVRVLRGEGR